MKQNKISIIQSRRLLTGILLLAGIGIVFWLLPKNESMEEGLLYLNDLEKKDLETSRQKVDEVKKAKIQQQLEDGTLPLLSLFDNSLIVGDSRANGFKYYGILPYSQVLAANGDTILNIDDHLEDIQARQPEVIYISYGMNDMGLEIGWDRGEDGYRQVFEEQIDKIKAVAPNAVIAVNSILAPTEEAVENAPAWAQRDDFNRQIQEMCEDHGYIYIDNEELTSQDMTDLYQSDGVHFFVEFYPDWAANMILSVLGN